MFLLGASFLASPVFLGVVGVLAVAVPVVLWLADRLRPERRRALSYSVAVAPLVDVNSEVRDRVKVLFDGQPIAHASLVTVRVRNSGSRPISAADFDKPMRIRFDGGTATILDTPDDARVPRDLSLSLSETSDGVTIEPLLLNPRDRFAVRFLAEGSGRSTPTLSARIAGVERVEREATPDTRADQSSRRAQTLTSVSAILGAVASVAAAIAAFVVAKH
jgi:hypothetical protein